MSKPVGRDGDIPVRCRLPTTFHLIRVANAKLGEDRGRVQSETLGYRHPPDDPLYWIRLLLTQTDGRLTHAGRVRMLGLPDAGDPSYMVRTTWHAKEVVRQIFTHANPDLAVELSPQIGFRGWPTL